MAAGRRDPLEALAAQAFDLALLDVLAAVRRSLAWRELPVIMVTAKSDSRDIVEALDLGADDYVTKPLDFPVALARVRAPLTRVAAERAALTLQRHGDLQKPFGTAAFLAAVRRARVSAAAPKRGRGTQALAMVADSLVPLAKAD